jgi:hypothetical protein
MNRHVSTSSLPEPRGNSREVDRAATFPLLRGYDQDATVELRGTPLAPTNSAILQREFSGSTDLLNGTIPGTRSQVLDDTEGSADRHSLQPCETAVELISGSRRSVLLSSKTEHLRDVQYGSIDLLSPWFPEVDPSYERAQTWRTWHSRQDVLLTAATTLSISVFLVNLVATITMQVKYRPSKGVASLFEGSCSWAKGVDTALHIFYQSIKHATPWCIKSLHANSCGAHQERNG